MYGRVEKKGTGGGWTPAFQPGVPDCDLKCRTTPACGRACQRIAFLPYRFPPICSLPFFPSPGAEPHTVLWFISWPPTPSDRLFLDLIKPVFGIKRKKVNPHHRARALASLAQSYPSVFPFFFLLLLLLIGRISSELNPCLFCPDTPFNLLKRKRRKSQWKGKTAIKSELNSKPDTHTHRHTEEGVYFSFAARNRLSSTRRITDCFH